MKLKDIKTAEKIIKNSTGIHLLVSVMDGTFVLINTDTLTSSQVAMNSAYPGINEGHNMNNIMLNDGYVSRKYNSHTLNLSDYMYFDSKSLSAADNKIIKRKTENILAYLESNQRHSKYFYTGEKY